MSVTYNLTGEPWVPVVTTDGKRRRASLNDLFDKPTIIRRLDIADPLARMGTIRLLLAIVYATHPGGMGVNEASTLLRHGHDPAILDYLRQWEGRFDLADPDRPFLQTPGLRPQGKEKRMGLRQLHPVLRRPVWQTMDPSQPVTPADAALLLIACRNYDVAGVHTGMAGDPDARDGKRMPQGVAQAGGLSLAAVEGSNLWETLLMNLPPHEGGDTPLWECDDAWSFADPTPEEPGAAYRYTHPSRRIRLLWGNDQLCHGAHVTYGIRSDWTHPEGEPCAFWTTKGERKPTTKPAVITFGQRIDLPLWALWNRTYIDKHGTTPYPKAIGWAWELTGRPVTFDTVAVRYGNNSSEIERIRQDHCTALPERLADPKSVELADQCLRTVNGRARSGIHPADTWRDLEEPMRAWLAGGPEPHFGGSHD